MKLPFKVTEDHIKRGKRGAGKRCAMAICLKETFGFLGLKEVIVWSDVYFNPEAGASLLTCLKTENLYCDWTNRFDNCSSVEPFEGEIDFPDELIDKAMLEIKEIEFA